PARARGQPALAARAPARPAVGARPAAGPARLRDRPLLSRALVRARPRARRAPRSGGLGPAAGAGEARRPGARPAHGLEPGAEGPARGDLGFLGDPDRGAARSPLVGARPRQRVPRLALARDRARRPLRLLLGSGARRCGPPPGRAPRRVLQPPPALRLRARS